MMMMMMMMVMVVMVVMVVNISVVALRQAVRKRDNEVCIEQEEE